jgi:hypothetical protein
LRGDSAPLLAPPCASSGSCCHHRRCAGGDGGPTPQSPLPSSFRSIPHHMVVCFCPPLLSVELDLANAAPPGPHTAVVAPPSLSPLCPASSNPKSRVFSDPLSSGFCFGPLLWRKAGSPFFGWGFTPGVVVASLSSCRGPPR